MICRDADKQELQECLNLLHPAFDAHEMRSDRQIYQLFAENRMHCRVGILQGRIVSCLLYWRLPDFYFLENFATDPAQRGRGIGSGLLKSFPEDAVLILEAELPKTDIAKRRIAFYRRNGFRPYAGDYLLPPLRKGMQPMPYQLMAKGIEVSRKEIRKIYRTVYDQKFSLEDADAWFEKAKH